MRTAYPHTTTFTTHALGAYADQASGNSEDFVIPEDFSQVTDEELAQLSEQARAAFTALYGEGSAFTDSDLEQLGALTEGIEAIDAELSTRKEAADARSARAAELASKVTPSKKKDDEEDDADSEDEDTDEDDADAEAPKDDAEDDTDADDSDEDEDDEDEDPKAKAKAKKVTKTVTASAGSEKPSRRSLRVDMSRASKHLPKSGSNKAPARMADITLASGEGSGFAAGQGINWTQAGEIMDRRLAGFNAATYAAAERAGRHMRHQQGVMSIRKPFSEDLVIDSSDALHVEEVLNRATSEKRLQGGSLVASGGWCAPSETLYDLLELETRDGIFSLPEVSVTRGGIVRTLGPNFADIYNSIEGFHYTEAEDAAGNYDGQGGGSKPCVKVGCPDFEEFRLELVGLCITAGLLQQRSYPEVIARTLRGALIAHEHRLANMSLASIERQSTAVTMPKSDGVTAPLLEAIELQVEHLRYSQRLSRSNSIEAVFPFWARGAIRADLSKRNGVDLISVTDQQINQWLTARGINAQFVYNWQDVNGLKAADFTAYPDQVKFLMYPAGTWVRGSSDIITMDSLFDSQQLGHNDYTALFTEEGWMVVKMGHDSRVVTVPLNASGVSGQQIDLSEKSVTLPLTGPAFAEPTQPSIIEAEPVPAPAPAKGDGNK